MNKKKVLKLKADIDSMSKRFNESANLIDELMTICKIGEKALKKQKELLKD